MCVFFFGGGGGFGVGWGAYIHCSNPNLSLISFIFMRIPGKLG